MLDADIETDLLIHRKIASRAFEMHLEEFKQELEIAAGRSLLGL
jgi:hypothetical protein